MYTRVGKNKQTQVPINGGIQPCQWGDASVTDGLVGCTLGAEGLHLGSFCAALSRCAMLLKHISAGNGDDDSPPLLPPT